MWNRIYLQYSGAELCIDQYYIVDNQDYNYHDDDHLDVIPYFIPDFHNNSPPTFPLLVF